MSDKERFLEMFGSTSELLDSQEKTFLEISAEKGFSTFSVFIKYLKTKHSNLDVVAKATQALSQLESEG